MNFGGEKKNQAVLIFPVYFMKAVTGPFEGLTNRSFKAATRVGSSQQSMNGRGPHGPITCCFLRASVEGPRHQTELNSDLGPCNLIISKGSLLGVIVCAGPRQLGSQEFLKQTARSYKRATYTKGFHL